jgi:phage FluMu protein Com
MKNLIYVIVIVLCLLVAAIVVFRGGSDSGGVDSISDDEQVWVMCRRCNASHEMSKKEFYKQLAEKAKESTNAMVAPHLTCEKCGKDAVTEAVKCEKCGNIFVKGSVPGDFPDRCPKCKFSKTEAVREERKRNMGQQ